MTAPRLLLDEDARPLLAAALQRSGFDAVHALDVGLSGAPDGEVLETAVGQRRALFTHNARDFIRLAAEYTRTGKRHSGVVVSPQGAFGDLLRRLLRFLSVRTAEDLHDTVHWLPR